MLELLLFIIAILVFIILIINIFIFKNVNNIKLKYEISGFQNSDRYTREEIIQKWNSLTVNCQNNRQKTLTEMIIQIALRRSKPDADVYLLRQVQNRGCFSPKDIPQNELAYFQQLWVDSNCSSEFPGFVINNIYSRPGMTFKLASKIFNDYILNIKKNINANDYPLETLEASFKKCYGMNWRNQPDLVTKYNTVDSMV